MHNQILIKFFILILFLYTSVFAQNRLNIGTIDSEPEEKFNKFKPLANYLQKKLIKKDIKVGVEIPENISNAIKLINQGSLDIFIDSVYPTLLVQKMTGISIEAKRWKKGSEGYKSIVFSKASSDIKSIRDLVGKTIAFEDEFSTSAYYVPKKAFENAGLNLSNQDEQSIKYSFAKSEENVVAWVLYSKVEAGVIDDKTFESFDKKLFKIIYKSKLIPRHLVSFSKRVDKKLKHEILNIFYNMHNDAEGKKVLKLFSKTKKITPLTKNDLDFITEIN